MRGEFNSLLELVAVVLEVDAFCPVVEVTGNEDFLRGVFPVEDSM